VQALSALLVPLLDDPKLNEHSGRSISGTYELYCLIPINTIWLLFVLRQLTGRLPSNQKFKDTLNKVLSMTDA
jgi:hypothetical protein